MEVNGTIPAVLISHLAVHKDHQRQHVGKIMLEEIIMRIIIKKLQPHIGCKYITLNPRDDDGVRSFYEYFEFKLCANITSDRMDTEAADAYMFNLS